MWNIKDKKKEKIKGVEEWMLSMKQIETMEKVLFGIAAVFSIPLTRRNLVEGGNIMVVCAELTYFTVAIYTLLYGILGMICGRARVEWVIRTKGKKVKGIVIRKECQKSSDEEDNIPSYRILFKINDGEKIWKSRTIESVLERDIPKETGVVYFWKEYPKIVVLEKRRYSELLGAIIIGMIGVGMLIGAWLV